MGKVDTGKMPQKIIAVAQYHSQLLTELYEKSSNRTTIINSALEIIGKNFGLYLDNLARRDHMSFHHVYETGQTGNENARLFKFTISGSNINYDFIPATSPEKSGQVFKTKAFVMEEGKSISITPKTGKFLAFQVGGQEVFSQKVFVPSPGGTRVAGSFKSAFESYMQNNANQLLTDIGFYDKIDNEIVKESDAALTNISNGNLNGSSMAKDSANRIAKRSKV